jgi:hypothetical protein
VRTNAAANYSPTTKAQVALASAVVLLCLSGLATYLTIVRLMEGEKWVVELKKSATQDPEGQAEISRQGLPIVSEITSTNAADEG